MIVPKNERTTNFELVDQRTEDQRWRDEATRKLAPIPGQREVVEAMRRRRQAERVGPFRRVLRFLRGKR